MSITKEVNSSRRVLFIAPQPYFTLRGTPLNLKTMTSCLSQNGFEVDLLCFPTGRDIITPGVNVIRSARVPGFRKIPIGFSWSKIAHNIAMFPKAISLLRKNNYCLIHGIEEGGVMSWILAKIFGLPFIVDMDSDIPDQLHQSFIGHVPGVLGIVKFLEKRAMRRSSAIITVCNALTERALKIAPKVPCFQIEDCPLDSVANVDSALKNKLAEELELSGKFTIVYTGNLAPYQGIELLIKSFAGLVSYVTSRKDWPELTLLIIGGDKNSKSEISRLAKKAKSLHVGKQVKFLGERSVDEMGTFLSLADAVVSPRKEGENTPLKLYSYMASGKPIIATKIRSHTQVLSEQNAFLGEPNVSSFTEALKACCDPDAAGVSRREQKAKNAKTLLDSHYSKEQFSENLLKSYQSVLGEKQIKYRIAFESRGLKPKILVTGAAGFVGENIVRQLRSLDLSVRAMVRKEEDVARLAGLGCEVVLADLASKQSLELAVEGIEKIYHIAAIFRQAGVGDEVYRKVNVEGTKALFEAAINANVKRIVHCSTVGVHGDVENPPADENAPYAPGDIYQRTKMEGEQIALNFFHSGKIGGVVIRPAMIYGPGDMRTLKLFKMIAKKRFFYVGKGAKHVHFIDVRDLAKAFYLAMEANSKNAEVYIISGNESLALKEFAKIVANELGVSEPWMKLPVKPVQLLGSCVESICIPLKVEPPIYRRRVDFFTKHRQFNSNKAREELNFSPSQNLQGEVHDICRWYIKEGFISKQGDSLSSLKKHAPSAQAFAMALAELI